MTSKKKDPNLKKGLLFVGMIDLILIVMLVFNVMPNLSITETSCSGTDVWIKYTLADEGTKLASTIADCASNPSGGWVGDVNFVVESPTGAESQIGGYQATKDSTQKINCGVSSQSGKTFAGGYVHNDGAGAYTVKVSGKYYLASENYATAHSFSWEKSVYAQCLLPDSKCPDGTALRQCSAVQTGKWCGADAALYDKASKCGCPEGLEASGNFCKPIPTEVPEEINPESPYGDGETTPPATNQTGTGGTVDTGGSTAGNEVFYFGQARTNWIIVLAVILLLIAALFMFKVV